MSGLYGGSTSSSTAGVLACQWYIAPSSYSLLPIPYSLLPNYSSSADE